MVALVRTLAKEPGSAALDSQHPIALQQARLKWLTDILLLQLQDALFQIVPQGQKAYLKVERCMTTSPQSNNVGTRGRVTVGPVGLLLITVKHMIV